MGQKGRKGDSEESRGLVAILRRRKKIYKNLSMILKIT